MRANRDPDSNLTGAFRDAYQHDIHDADSADDQRHAGDETQQHGHRAGSFGGRFGDLQLAGHFEKILDLGLFGGFDRDAMALEQELADPFFDLGESLLAGGLDVDAAQASSFADQLFDRRAAGYDNRIVLVRPAGGHAFCREHTDDREGHVLDADDLPNRVVLAEQFFGGHRTDHGHLAGAALVLFGKNLALDRPPLANGEIVGRVPINFRAPITVAG